MNSFLKFLLTFLFLSIFLFANSSKSIFASYESSPERAYIGEIFPISLKVIVTRSDYKTIQTSLNSNSNFKLLNQNNSWTKDLSKGHLQNTFYLQVLKKTSTLPELKIELSDANQILEQTILNGKNIEIIELNNDKKFSKVLAQSFAVKTVATNRFDNKNIIVTLFIEATLSNLNDFSLPFVAKQNIDLFSQRTLMQSIQYNTIVPDFTTSLDFTYFNTKTNSFENVKVPIIIQNDDVSTHTDINPKENKLKLYKDIFFGFLTLLFFALFIWKRKKVFIILSILLVVYLFYGNNNFNKIKILSNSNIQVLPTERSTIFYTTETILTVEKLNDTQYYYKIILPNGKIGWVEKKYVIKN